MELQYITCSDPREHIEIEDIINLGKRYPIAEFAVQAHPTKFSKQMDRYEWFRTLAVTATVNNVRLAMHVNSEWRTELCRGNIPNELRELWNMRRIRDNSPVIGRVQININGGKDKFDFDANKVAAIIRAYPDIKFILQYAPVQHERITQLDKTGVPFALLQDSSGGRGESPDSWLHPVLPNHQMGYSGGLSPDNIVDNLNQINKILPDYYSTWPDAEGNLKSPNAEGKNVFDIKLAEKYLERAAHWQEVYGFHR